MQYQALHFSPMIPSFDLAETGNFFKEILGFTAVMETETYAIYQKDNRSVHLLRAGADIGQMECYLEVTGIDELWNSMAPRVSGLSVRSPFDQEYGMLYLRTGSTGNHDEC